MLVCYMKRQDDFACTEAVCVACIEKRLYIVTREKCDCMFSKR